MPQLYRLKSLLTALLVVWLSITAAGAFSDTQGHPSEEAIDKWSTQYALISGYADGTFRPDDSVTRGAFAGILDRMLHFSMKSPPSTFRDTAGDYWEDAILKLHANGVLQGFDGYANPSAPITRQQVVSMLARAFHFSAGSAHSRYVDDMEIEDYARGVISRMTELGYLDGVAGDYFRPNDPITRADVVRIFDNMISVMILTEEPLSEDVTGNVLVSCTDGATLRGMRVFGDLYIAHGVTGSVVLEDATIDGEILNFSPGAVVETSPMSAPPDEELEPVPNPEAWEFEPVSSPDAGEFEPVSNPDGGEFDYSNPDMDASGSNPEMDDFAKKKSAASDGDIFYDPGKTVDSGQTAAPADSGVTTPTPAPTPTVPEKTVPATPPAPVLSDNGEFFYTPGATSNNDSGKTTAPVTTPAPSTTTPAQTTPSYGDIFYDPGATTKASDSGKTAAPTPTPLEEPESQLPVTPSTPSTPSAPVLSDNGEFFYTPGATSKSNDSGKTSKTDSGKTPTDSGKTADSGKTSKDSGKTADSGKTSNSGDIFDPGQTSNSGKSNVENPEFYPPDPYEPNPENETPIGYPDTYTPYVPANTDYGTLPNKPVSQLTISDVYTPGRTTGQYISYQGSNIPVYAGVKTRNVYAGDFVWRTGHRLRYLGGRYDAKFGVDVSAYQNRDRANGTINWAAAKADGVQFAMIRVGLRGTSTGALREDAYYGRNIDGAMAQGIQTGVYIFAQAKTIAEAIEEADFVIARLRYHKINGPVSYDWEMKDSSYRVYGTSKEMATACAVAFCKRVAAAGYTPMVYNSRYVCYLKYDQGALAPYMMWYPQYPGTDIEYPYPNLYYQMDYWQFTDSAVVEGIGKKIDANIWFKAK